MCWDGVCVFCSDRQNFRPITVPDVNLTDIRRIIEVLMSFKSVVSTSTCAQKASQVFWILNSTQYTH